MNKVLLLLLVLIASVSVMAQSPIKITGQVVDSVTTKPVGYATIELATGAKTVASATSDANGSFTVSAPAAGTYQLSISFVGYRTHTVAVEAKDAEVHVTAVQLAPEGKQLGNVTVVAQKALIEDKGDRLVYNAERDISNAGGNAADVLRKVPTLNVDLDGKVEMRGSTNIKVLVNGKPSAMMARNLADALKQMPASIIKSVEVITNPGAKYDAEGTGGVINIITKKALQGFNGNVMATGGNMNRSLSTTLNLKRQKLGLTFAGNVYQYRNIQEGSSLTTTFHNGQAVSRLARTYESDNVGTGVYGDIGLDYDPDSTTHINLSVNAWGGDFPFDGSVNNRLTDMNGAVLQDFRTERTFTNPYGNGQVNGGYTKTFKGEKEFALLAQYSHMPDNYFYTTNKFEGEERVYREKSTNYSRNKEYTIQADYVYPLTLRGRKDTATGKLELGSKAIIRDIGSEYEVEQSLNGSDDLVLDPTQSNNFNYTQRVYSGYASLRLSNSRKWNLSAGARLEHTQIEGDFKTTGTQLETEYSNLIPSVTLSKGINKHTLKASYTQRITRPMIWYLNPWVNQSDPKNLTTGNPDLDPELSHSVDVGHSFMGKKGFTLNTSLYWRINANAIEYVSSANPEGVTMNRPENIARRQGYGANVNVSVKPNKDWTVNSGGELRYIDYNSPALGFSNSGFIWMGNLNTTYKLPKDYTVQAYGSINSGSRGLQRTTSTLSYWYGLSAKHSFWKQKGHLTVGVNNPFQRGVPQKSVSKGATFLSESSNMYVTRSARITFEWRFGQMNGDGGKKGKKIKNDDSGR